MAFKVKDLMVHVLPEDVQAPPTTCSCRPRTSPSECLVSSPLFADAIGGCRPCTIVTWGTCTNVTFGACTNISGGFDLAATSPAASLTALATLKEQLKQQLAAIETRHAAAEESLRPQTVEEVDLLTNKLNDALEELKARRAELSQKA